MGRMTTVRVSQFLDCHANANVFFPLSWVFASSTWLERINRGFVFHSSRVLVRHIEAIPCTVTSVVLRPNTTKLPHIQVLVGTSGRAFRSSCPSLTAQSGVKNNRTNKQLCTSHHIPQKTKQKQNHKPDSRATLCTISNNEANESSPWTVVEIHIIIRCVHPSHTRTREGDRSRSGAPGGCTSICNRDINRQTDHTTTTW